MQLIGFLPYFEQSEEIFLGYIPHIHPLFKMANYLAAFLEDFIMILISGKKKTKGK